MRLLEDFTLLDFISFGIFILTWFIYRHVWNERAKKPSALSHGVNHLRKQWFINAAGKNVRIQDTQILNIHQQTAVFFASTSILIIGLLMAGLGSVANRINDVNQILWIHNASVTELSLKLMVLIYMFIYSFFKFAWSIRLNNYLGMMIGAIPEDQREGYLEYAEAATQLSMIIGYHYTLGIRAYFFALAFLGWFIDPWVFIAATFGVIWTIYRRDSHSIASKVILSVLENQKPADHQNDKNQK